MNDLASALDLSGGALTQHIRRLENCGLIRINTDTPGHGNLKMWRHDNLRTRLRKLQSGY